jgi:hypothetical protein
VSMKFTKLNIPVNAYKLIDEDVMFLMVKILNTFNIYNISFLWPLYWETKCEQIKFHNNITMDEKLKKIKI